MKFADKVALNRFMENYRHERFNDAQQILKEYDDTFEAQNIKMLYFYKVQANEDYDMIKRDICDEYRTGILDPSREVGRIEKQRTTIKKVLRQMQLKSRK